MKPLITNVVMHATDQSLTLEAPKPRLLDITMHMYCLGDYHSKLNRPYDYRCIDVARTMMVV